MAVSIEMVSILQKHLPYIMEGVMTELKLELDKTHKCLLLKDSKIKDKVNDRMIRNNFRNGTYGTTNYIRIMY